MCGAHGPCGALSGNKQPTTSTWTSARGSWLVARPCWAAGSRQQRQHRRRLPCFLFCVIYEIISHTHAHMDTQLRIMMLACLGQAGGQTAGLGGLS